MNPPRTRRDMQACTPEPSRHASRDSVGQGLPTGRTSTGLLERGRGHRRIAPIHERRGAAGGVANCGKGSMKEGRLSRDGWLGVTSFGWLGFEPGSSLYCTLGGGVVGMGSLLRWRNSTRDRQAVSFFPAPAGANGCWRMSICQIASASLRRPRWWRSCGRVYALDLTP